jgi:hypothetical protein
MWAEVAVEVLMVAGAFRASKAGWNAVEESRDSTSDIAAEEVAGRAPGFFDCAPPILPPPLRSE